LQCQNVLNGKKETKKREKKNRTFSSVVVALREFMSYEIRYPHPPREREGAIDIKFVVLGGGWDSLAYIG
jgi:hypothetical protein